MILLDAGQMSTNRNLVVRLAISRTPLPLSAHFYLALFLFVLFWFIFYTSTSLFQVVCVRLQNGGNKYRAFCTRSKGK